LYSLPVYLSTKSKITWMNGIRTLVHTLVHTLDLPDNFDNEEVYQNYILPRLATVLKCIARLWRGLTSLFYWLSVSSKREIEPNSIPGSLPCTRGYLPVNYSL
jgi:hypothetical protein